MPYWLSYPHLDSQLLPNILTLIPILFTSYPQPVYKIVELYPGWGEEGRFPSCFYFKNGKGVVRALQEKRELSMSFWQDSLYLKSDSS